MSDLSEDEVFANDEDPLEAISKIRREEENSSDTNSDEVEEDTSETQEDAVEDTETTDETSEDVAEDTSTDDDTDTEDASDSDTNEEALSDTEDTPKATTRKFTASGKEYEFTDQEILDKFEVVFGQAVDYTQKTQKIAPYRKMISALESEGISSDQLDLAIDALKGNPEALQSMMKMNKVDAFDVANLEDKDDSYIPTSYGKDQQQLDIDEVTSTISADPEYQITVDVVDNQWDDESRTTLASNPGMIQGLHNDIKSGLYDKVAPEAMKMKVLDRNRKSNLEYYILAGEKVLSTGEQEAAKADKSVAELNKDTQDAEKEFDRASSEADRKRSASTTRSRSDRKGAIDYLDDNDEDFDAWYKNLEASN